MIRVEGKLPFLSDSMLLRLYGDKVEKLTMGFEVEVAVNPDGLSEYVELDVEEFDIDAARQQFINSYKHMEFGKWASYLLTSEAEAYRFTSQYSIVPKFGWCAKGGKPTTVEFLALVQRFQVLEKGPAFRDMMSGLADLFDPVFYEPIPHQLIGPSKTPVVNDTVSFKPTVSPIFHDIVRLLVAAVRSVVEEKDGAYFKIAEGVLAGANLYMNPNAEYLTRNMLKKLGELVLRKRDSERADWAKNAILLMTKYAEQAQKKLVDESRLLFWTTDDPARSLNDFTTYNSLRDVLAKLYEAEDALALDLFSDIDIVDLQFDYERARDEKEHLDEEAFIENARDQWEKDQEIMPTTNASSAIAWASERLENDFPDERFGGGSEGTDVVEDTSIDPTGFEIISPPMKPSESLTWLAGKFNFIDDYEIMSTNNSTGLHCNIGTWRDGPYYYGDPAHTIDVLKLLVFLEDQHLLSTFGRTFSTYAESMLSDLQYAIRKESISRDTRSLNKTITKINATLLQSANKFRSVNLNKLHSGYLEFRIMGGESYHQRFPDVRRTALRFAQICVVAANPDLYRKQYLNQLYRLVTQTTGRSVDISTEKQFASLFRAFVIKNAATFFGSSYKPKATAWELWTVNELPEKLIEFLNTKLTELPSNYQKTRPRVFAWIVDVLSKTGYSLPMREKLVSYVLMRFDRTALVGKYDSDDMINGHTLHMWPWLQHIKRVL